MFRKKHLEIDLLKIRIKTLEAQIKKLQAEISNLKAQKSGSQYLPSTQSGQGWILSGGSSISGKYYFPYESLGDKNE